MHDVKVLTLIGAIALVMFLIARFRLVPFLALILATLIFGLVAGSDPQWIAKGFNIGFGQTIAAGGLAILAGTMVAGLGAVSGGIAYWRKQLTERAIRLFAIGMAFIAGLGGTSIGALAVLTPVLTLANHARTRLSLATTATANAAQGALLPSPLPIAALAILDADWRLMLAFGFPVAAAQIIAGLAVAHYGPDDSERSNELPHPALGLAGIGFLLASVCLVILVVCHALGQIPSEPFGSGTIRERLLGAGRPMLLLLAGLGLSLVFMVQRASNAVSETGALATAARNSAGILLAIGAAGGFQMVLHVDGFADLVAERVAELPPTFGIAIPFLIALASRALQGSALTATITAAGIMQPLIGPMGLGGAEGRALAALAAATGAVALPLINDGTFWLACHNAGLRAPQGLRWITGGAMVQGAAAMAVLILLARWIT